MRFTQLPHESRRQIGDLLLACNGETMSMASIARTYGITPISFCKWMKTDRIFWELTRHVSDAELARYVGQSYYGSESEYFNHAQGFRQLLKDLRETMLSGTLGIEMQELERTRKAEEVN